MKVLEIQQIISNINKKALQIPFMFIGSTGIGKTWSMRELAKYLEIGHIGLYLATQEVTDLIGMPRTEKIDGEIRTIWTKPCWFPREGTRGILVLEEINRAPEDVRQAIFQLLTEWKLHTHELPKTWSIVTTINPDNGNYHVNCLDTAFRRRFVQVVINNPDTLEWGIWAKKNHLADEVISFTNSFPNLLSKDEEIKIEAIPTHAGYHLISTLLQNEVIPNNCLHEIICGIVGIEAGTTFIKSLSQKFEKPISAEEVFKHYPEIESKHKKQIKDKQNDLLYMTMIDIIAKIEEDKKDFTKTEINNFSGFLNNSSEETFITVVKRICVNNNASKLLVKLSEHEPLLKKIENLKKELAELI